MQGFSFAAHGPNKLLGSPRLALALRIFEACWLIQPLQEIHSALGSAEAVPGLVRIVMRQVRRKKYCQTLLNGENASDLIKGTCAARNPFWLCVAIDRPCRLLYSSCPPDDRVDAEWKRIIAFCEIQ